MTRSPQHRSAGARLSGVMLALCLGLGGAARAQTAILTHHGNIARTGWNDTETVLTPATVATSAPGGFGHLATIALDAQVDAQPLVVPNVIVAGDPNPGTHDVVYVATQGNTLYAIDPVAGSILLSRNFGPPFLRERGCNSKVRGVGIASTPVIDLTRHAIYLIAATADAGGPTYRLHMLDLSTLADIQPPAVVAAEQSLTDGSIFTFNAEYERQRPALLEDKNAIFAGFGSFCDGNYDKSRGWVIGWRADTLYPVKATNAHQPLGELLDRQPALPGVWLLASVWMSGAGIASDGNAMYFVTGNSDPSGASYNSTTNLSQSVVKLSYSTTTVLDFFTPQNLPMLEKNDSDFGSGGIALLPPAGHLPLAVAAGKFGTLYLLDRNGLGGYTPGGPDRALAEATIGRCWCVASYFAAPTPTIVSSGASTLQLWTIQSSPTWALVPGAAAALPTPPYGFFTTVSSNGAADPVIWAVLRPALGGDGSVSLYAFSGIPAGSPPALVQLFAAVAGTWPATGTMANIVPVVANGRVYVASYQQLQIFGLTAAAP